MPGVLALDQATTTRRDPMTGRFAAAGRTIDVECRTCGVPLRRVRYRADRYKYFYCSPKCRGLFMRGAQASAWRGGSTEYTCGQCGAPFLSRPCLGSGGQKPPRFCSRQCSHDSQRKFPTAADRRRDSNRRASYRRRAAGTANVRRLNRQHTEEEWTALVIRYKDRCAGCKKKRKLTRDHIIPLSKGGTDDITNIQPLCLPCNSAKRDNRTQLL